jgi:dihydroorotase
MNILIRSARITDPNSPHNGKKTDILIEGGEIVQIKQHIKTEEKVKIIEGDNIHVSPGWVDMQANFRDPGFEFKEDLESGMNCAAAGGFTGVCIMPSTNPPLHSKSQIDYVLNKAKGNIVDVFPLGTVSHNHEGKDLSEMYDMKMAGAYGFSDDKKAIKDAGLVLRALQYSQNIGSFIMTHCDDASISHGGQMNEGEQSTRMGLKGMPGLAEELMLERNLSILSYAGGKLHVPTVSTKRSVELIKHAKAQGLNVTAGVAAVNLLLDDSVLNDFNTNLKLNPPLRSREDVDALKRGLANGTIDVVVSDHIPEDTENKELEFDYACYGALGLETAYPAFQTSCGKKLEVEAIVQVLAVNPRTILGIKQPLIAEGEKANLTIFDPEAEWTFEQKNIRSKSQNTALVGYTFTGKVIGIVNKNHLHLEK